MTKSKLTGAFRFERYREARVAIDASGAPSYATQSPPDPDADVVRLIYSGDLRAALCLLMQRHGIAVYRYCRKALNDATLAEDVHQQIFIEAYRDLTRFAGRSTVRSWLMGISRHRVLDAAKRRRRRAWDAAVGELPEVSDLRPSAFEVLSKKELYELILANLEQLDEPARSAVLLRFQQDLSFEQMAKLGGESPGTLHTRVARALRRLRAKIESCIGS